MKTWFFIYFFSDSQNILYNSVIVYKRHKSIKIVIIKSIVYKKQKF